MRIAASLWAPGAVLVAGLVLRVWGLGFGLPHTEARPDESLLVHRALAVAGGDLNPHFFNYPSLHIYLLAALYGFHYLLLRLLGDAGGAQDFLSRFFVDPAGIYLWGRALTAAMGTATLVWIYRAARSIHGPAAGLGAAILGAGAFLHVRDSHFLTVDVPATFWAAGSLAMAVQHLGDGRRGTLLAAAVLGGLSASTKYSTALFLPALLLAAYSSPMAWPRWRTITAVLVAWGVAFAAGSPHVVLDAQAFWRDLAFEWRHFGRGHGIDLGNGWIYHLTFSLRHGLGWPLLAASLAGLCWLAARRGPADRVILAGVVVYFLVAGAGASLFVRYVIPLVPLACVAAACGLSRAAGGRMASTVAACLLLAAPPTAASLAHDRLLARTDTRVLAASWIEKHAEAGARVAFTGSSYGHPQLRPEQAWIERQLREVRRAGDRGRRLDLQKQDPAYPPPPAYDLVELREGNPRELSSIWPLLPPSELRARGVDWLVVQQHPLAYAVLPVTLAVELSVLQPAVEFDPFECGTGAAVYDPLDAYYAPLSGHGALRRPGPRLRIYRLAD